MIIIKSSSCSSSGRFFFFVDVVLFLGVKFNVFEVELLFTSTPTTFLIFVACRFGGGGGGEGLEKNFVTDVVFHLIHWKSSFYVLLLLLLLLLLTFLCFYFFPN